MPRIVLVAVCCTFLFSCYNSTYEIRREFNKIMNEVNEVSMLTRK